VRQATEAYLQAEDAFAAWIEEKCEREPKAGIALTQETTLPGSL
jgi:phage/plasmid-associated DNA primase